MAINFYVIPTDRVIKDVSGQPPTPVIDNAGRINLTEAEFQALMQLPATNPARRIIVAAMPLAPIASKRLGAILAADGNSLVALAISPFTSSLTPSLDIGFMNWAMALSKHALRWRENRGLSGSTIAESTARLASWVPSTTANHLVYLEGVNTIAAYSAAGLSLEAAADAAYADLLVYLADARAYGKFQRIFLCTTPPRNLSASWNASIDLFNRRVRSLCAQDGLYVLVDLWSACVDPASTTAYAKANYLQADNLHPSAKGARALGAEFARVINLLNYPASNLVAGSSVTRVANPAALYINSNPTLLGTPAGGAQLLGGATGLVAPGWRTGVTTGTMTAVASVVADSGGIGNAQRLTITGASSGAIAQIGTHATEAIPYQVGGDWLKAMAKIKFSGAVNVSAVYCRLIWNGASNNYTVDGQRDNGATVSPSLYDNSDVDNMFITTPAVLFPGNVPAVGTLAANFYVLFGAAGGAITLDVSQGGLLNLGQTLTDY